MEDEQIIELYFARSEEAIHETDRKYGRYCHTISYRILEDDEDAREIVNDTLLRAWNTIPPQHPSSLKTYVGMISRRLSLDRIDQKKAEKRGGGQVALALEELGDCVSGEYHGDDMNESVALTDALNRFLRTLTERARTIFVRRYWYMCSIAELAEAYSMKESRVGMLLLRTRQNLQKFLEKEGFHL